MTKGIVHGIRVPDLSPMLSGSYCNMMLADHSAKVIKIEVTFGDTSRKIGPFRDDDPDHYWAGYLVGLNRNKKSVRLDLKSADGKVAFRDLAATADVVVDDVQPGVMERLGLSFEALVKPDPRLLDVAIRGFGDPHTGESPYDDWPSCDVIALAIGGSRSVTGPDAASPTKAGPVIGDVFPGLMISFGILTALRDANATGNGQFVDVSMYDSLLSLCERAAYLHDMTGTVPVPEGNVHPFLAPFELFPATDGSIATGIVDETLFGPLNTIADIFADQQIAAPRMLQRVPYPDPGARPWTVAANPVKFTSYENSEFAPPPRLGEHNDDFLNVGNQRP